MALDVVDQPQRSLNNTSQGPDGSDSSRPQALPVHCQ